jgi:hypothetical protein
VPSGVLSWGEALIDGSHNIALPWWVGPLIYPRRDRPCRAAELMLVTVHVSNHVFCYFIEIIYYFNYRTIEELGWDGPAGDLAKPRFNERLHNGTPMRRIQ